MTEIKAACERAIVHISHLFHVSVDEVKNIMQEITKL